MKAFFDLLKKLYARSLKVLGGAPQHYWNYVLIFWFLLFVGLFMLDAVVFMNMQESAFGEVYLPASIGVKSVDRVSLNAAAQIVSDRQGRFAGALKASVLQNPGQ